MKRPRRTRRRRERTIREALVNPRTKAERAAKEELKRLGARLADSFKRSEEMLRDMADPTRLIPPGAHADPRRFLPPGARAIENIKPLAEQIADALAARKPPRKRGPGVVKDEDEAAFAAVRELLRRRPDLSAYAACVNVARPLKWNAKNFYKRWLSHKVPE